MAIHRSALSDVAISDCTITELVLRGVADRADAPVLIDGPTGRVLTGRQLRAGIERLAGGFAARGIGPGSVVAIMAPNLPEYALVFHAAAWAGATVTTLNPTYTAEEVRQQLRDSGACLLVTIPPMLEIARAGAEGTGASEVAVIGAAEGATPLDALMGEPLTAQVPVDPATHVVALPYSSGTTGLPKGVMLTHRNLVANVAQVGGAMGIAPGASTLAFLPYFHIYGLVVQLNLYLARGGVQVTMPRFDLEGALRLIEGHRITHLYVVPPVVLAFAKHPAVEGSDLSSLEFVLSGAAPLGAELAAACEGRIGVQTIQGYGMTEMSPVSHFTPPGRNRPGASGLAVPNTECRIVDPETGLDCAAGAEGELWVRGPQVMSGYLDRREATAATLTPDGWLRTGDRARIDADGYLFIVDRVKELIKVKGFQVAPAELEALLVAHPAVADVAVVGIADEEAGEVPKAFVVPAAGAKPALAELQAFLDGHVAHYKQIHGLALVEAIPKSPSGKILRRVLRAQG
jgi:acyl-CoA synthetase (AMP-forming)/AMP-acid ligase II